MAAFLLIFDNLMQALTADYRKNHLTFKFLTIRVFPLQPQNEIQLLSRFPCYSRLVCLFCFSAEESDATGFNESDC